MTGRKKPVDMTVAQQLIAGVGVGSPRQPEAPDQPDGEPREMLGVRIPRSMKQAIAIHRAKTGETATELVERLVREEMSSWE